MKKIDVFFDVSIAKSIDLNTALVVNNGVNYVGRITANNGVVCRIEQNALHLPENAGTISVALVGNAMFACLQYETYYASQNIAVLTPRLHMNEQQLLYYCLCIRKNAFRFNYGRNGHKGIYELMLPDISDLPTFVMNHPIPDYSKMTLPAERGILRMDILKWKPFRYDELFVIERGTGPRKQDISFGKIPFVTSTDTNNGVTAFCNHVPMHNGNTITVNRNGSVAEAFYQANAFCSTEDVHVFSPKFDLNKYIAMFFISLIQKEKYRYSYGRKWGIERMNNSIIRLPVTPNGKPDYAFMERYIKSLPYSSAI